MGTSGAFEKTCGHVVRGPARRGGPAGPYKRFRLRRNPWRKAGSIPAAQMKKGSRPACGGMGHNVQNPTYITTVWGYGYKWGF